MSQAYFLIRKSLIHIFAKNIYIILWKQKQKCNKKGLIGSLILSMIIRYFGVGTELHWVKIKIRVAEIWLSDRDTLPLRQDIICHIESGMCAWIWRTVLCINRQSTKRSRLMRTPAASATSYKLLPHNGHLFFHLMILLTMPIYHFIEGMGYYDDFICKLFIDDYLKCSFPARLPPSAIRVYDSYARHVPPDYT